MRGGVEAAIEDVAFLQADARALARERGIGAERIDPVIDEPPVQESTGALTRPCKRRSRSIASVVSASAVGLSCMISRTTAAYIAITFGASAPMPCSSVSRNDVSVLSAKSSGLWLICAAGPISIRMSMTRAIRSSASRGSPASSSEARRPSAFEPPQLGGDPFALRVSRVGQHDVERSGRLDRKLQRHAGERRQSAVPPSAGDSARLFLYAALFPEHGLRMDPIRGGAVRRLDRGRASRLSSRPSHGRSGRGPIRGVCRE